MLLLLKWLTIWRLHHCNPGGNAANFTTATNVLLVLCAGGALKAVNDEIDNIDDLDASGTTNILSAASRLGWTSKSFITGWEYDTAIDNLATTFQLS